ncbi:MAG: hypothetical protein Q9170_002971 [Blastenia crenularia]
MLNIILWYFAFAFTRLTSAASSSDGALSLNSLLLNESWWTDLNASSFDVPIRPAVIARDTRIHITATPSPTSFRATELYFNIFSQMVNFWKLPEVRYMRATQYLATAQFPGLEVVIEPYGQIQRLTTAMTATVLSQLLSRLVMANLNPVTFVTTLTRRNPPPVPIGTISTAVTGRVDANENTYNASDSNDNMVVRLRYDGQKLEYLPITPAVFLHYFGMFTASILGAHSVSDLVAADPARPSVAISVAEGAKFRLYSQVNVTREGPPLDWGDVIQGLNSVLENVVIHQRFELVSAEFVIEGRLAATYGFYFMPKPKPKPGTGDGGVESA